MIKTFPPVKRYILNKYPGLRRTLSVFYIQYYNLKREIALLITRPKYEEKVFCIGFQKTGTTSLGRSLKMLGYNHSSFDSKVYMRLYKRKGDVYNILKITSKYDSFDDLPWSKEDLIPVLDKVFPNSKFIYLVRDEETWKKSMNNWYFKKFGIYPDLSQKLLEYRGHRSFVMAYFQDRIGKDLLILDIKDVNGFQKLANFLGKEAPSQHFPHFNQTELIPVIYSSKP